MQISLFDGNLEFKIDKPIRLIELFAGYGSQSLALKYLGVPFEHHRIAEWTIKSTQAYKDLHFENDNTDYSKKYSVEYLIDYLFEKGVSQNYSEPMTKEQIKRLGEEKIRIAYNNIIATHNIVSVCTAKGKDLGITDTDKYCYIMTYSFPCTDLSNAGKGLGMAKGSGTRSGLLWEVERLLDECIELPYILLMENVPQVIGQNNIQHFAKWIEKLEQLGYKNKWQVLNAKDFGIPQNRERCFMVSILGDYYYDFPKTIPLKLRLKDMLETEVDEKYYLSDRMLNYIVSEDDKYKVNENSLVINRDIACTINTRVGNTRADASDFICNDLPDNYNLKKELCNNLVKNGMVEEGDIIRHSYTKSRMQGDMKDIKEKGLCPTLDTRCDCLGVTVKEETDKCNCIGTLQGGKWDKMHDIGKRVYSPNGCSPTIHTCGGGNLEPKIAKPKNYRIRKLTPKECWRLMGVKDEDFEKVAKNQSNSSLYHLAGDSIVTTCLMAIFGQMTDIDYKEKLKKLQKTY
jgi:DNA (cytosine-5)-methyltransferase 1